MNSENSRIFNDFAEKGWVNPFSVPAGMQYCQVFDKRTNRFEIYPLPSKALQKSLKIMFHEAEKRISPKELEDLIETLEVQAIESPIKHNLSQRCCVRNGKIYYSLNSDRAVCMKDGGYKIIKAPRKMFIYSSFYKEQVRPSKGTDPSLLPGILQKHINLGNDNDILLFSIYLASCFSGGLANIPILILTGEKGSSKSTVMRMVEQIVDPKHIDLCGIPGNVSDLELRLMNSYYLTLDNLSYLSKRMSDTLARSVTGGTSTKRKLYEDTEEITINLKCLVAINGISLVAREADLLDRSLIFRLQRIDKEDIKTEKELWKSFESDLSDILGCCFQLVSTAMSDDEPIQVAGKTRLADFFDLAIKIGRALGYSDEDVAELLWAKQKEVNEYTLLENIVAQCLVEFMKRQKRYEGAVTELLNELQNVAIRNYMPYTLLPKAPNILSRRLNEIKSNLEQLHGIYYEIRNVGTFRKIIIHKK